MSSNRKLLGEILKRAIVFELNNGLHTLENVENYVCNQIIM